MIVKVIFTFSCLDLDGFWDILVLSFIWEGGVRTSYDKHPNTDTTKKR